MAATSHEPVPVWLDCDPGHDDVFAILFAAYHPGIRLLGISTVFGNAPLEKTTWNAASVLTAIAKHNDIPIYQGAATPLVRPLLRSNAEDIHGESGLDGTSLLPKPLVAARNRNSSGSGSGSGSTSTSTSTSTSAATTTKDGDHVDAMEAAAAALRECQPGTAWVVATGSLTNAAMLFQQSPDLVGHVKGLSIMGGAVGGGHRPSVLTVKSAAIANAVYGIVDGKARVGNWTPWAEFNIIIDPEAAAFIFDTKELAAKTTILPLDVTHLVLARQDVQELLLYGPDKAQLDEHKVESIETAEQHRKGKTTLRTMLVELLMFFAKTYKDVFGIIEGPPLHDPLAVAAVLTGTPWDIGFYEYNVNNPSLSTSSPSSSSPPTDNNSISSDTINKRERYDIEVITKGTHEDALHRGSQLGRTIATLLPPGSEGVLIPRGLNVAKFWKVMEECVQRADEANAALAAVGAETTTTATATTTTTTSSATH